MSAKTLGENLSYGTSFGSAEPGSQGLNPFVKLQPSKSSTFRIHVDMGVSRKWGYPPNHPFLIRVFHYKPSILGYPYFWKHPHIYRICFSFHTKYCHTHNQNQSRKNVFSFDTSQVAYQRCEHQEVVNIRHRQMLPPVTKRDAPTSNSAPVIK